MQKALYFTKRLGVDVIDFQACWLDLNKALGPVQMGQVQVPPHNSQ